MIEVPRVAKKNFSQLDSMVFKAKEEYRSCGSLFGYGYVYKLFIFCPESKLWLYKWYKF